jgi:RimJ/RimL family protein N-acetyltransferase
MTFTIRPINEQDVNHIIRWRYTGSLAFYNPRPDDWLWLLDPDNRYHTISTRAGTIEGVFCLGFDARVDGGSYTEEALDVGIGLHPDLVGRGLGMSFLHAVLTFARRELQPGMFRVTVAQFNHRARRLFEKAGFRPIRTFTGTTLYGEYEFVQMIQEE